MKVSPMKVFPFFYWGGLGVGIFALLPVVIGEDVAVTNNDATTSSVVDVVNITKDTTGTHEDALDQLE